MLLSYTLKYELYLAPYVILLKKIDDNFLQFMCSVDVDCLLSFLKCYKEPM